MARLIVGLAVLVAATGFAPVPRPKPERKYEVQALLKKLQGTWEIVSTERMLPGAAGRMTSRSIYKLRFDGERWSYVFPENVKVASRLAMGGELKLDTSKPGPAIMDLIRAPMPGQKEGVPMMRGIIKVERDTVKFCYTGSSATDRPTSFDELGVNQMLMTLKKSAQ